MNKTIIFLLLITFAPWQVIAEDKLLQPSDLIKLGSFRLPSGDQGVGTAGFAYGGQAIAYNPVNNSLFITGHKYFQAVAEVAIPETLSMSGIAKELPVAQILQPLTDATEGKLRYLNPDGSYYTGQGILIGGMYVHQGKLIGASYVTYGGYEVTRSHWRSGLDLSVIGDFEGNFDVGTPSQVENAGYIGGYVTKVPESWQERIGYPLISGQGGLSTISSRSSFGPAIFAYDPDEFVEGPAISSAIPCIYYNASNTNIGGWNSESSWYRAGTSVANGAVWPTGSKSILTTGLYGVGETCYGYGNTNGTAGGEPRTTRVGGLEIAAWMDANETDNYPCGTTSVPRSYLGGDWHSCCYDPLGSAPGAHAYPYKPYVLAYDADDLMRVKNGGRIVDDPSPNLVTDIYYSTGVLDIDVKVDPTSTTTYKPYHIKPYVGFAIDTPFKVQQAVPLTGGIGYDEANQIIYISETMTGYPYAHPIITAFKINLDPPPDPTCTDGFWNGDETGIDCGGSCPEVCPTPDPNCSDGILNQDETAIDCGGVCDPCIVPPACDDGVQNGTETGVDCGGSCPACPPDPEPVGSKKYKFGGLLISVTNELP